MISGQSCAPQGPQVENSWPCKGSACVCALVCCPILILLIRAGSLASHMAAMAQRGKDDP